MSQGRRLELKNLRVGKLTVVERAEKPSHINYSGSFWLCRCDCGIDIVREGRALDLAAQRGRLSSCGCALSEAKSKGGQLLVKDITGQVFGSLTVKTRTVRPIGSTQRSAYWICHCYCGKELVAHSGEIRSSKRHHCGCKTTSRIRLPGDEAAKRRVLQVYRTSAAKRNLVFDLTEEEFFSLASDVCHYCGSPPARREIAYRRASADSVFLSNGIDRQDNELGYSRKNCVSCCEQCNKSKRCMTPEEFKQWVTRVYRHYVKDSS